MNRPVPTPICDFVSRYAASGPVRVHMPGHKGSGPLGVETLDITEIDGADDLQAPRGIIAESEQVASSLFGARTHYATGGSSQCIRAMLYLACTRAAPGTRPRVLAGRNAHRVFMSAAALIDFDIDWLMSGARDALASCAIAPQDVAAVLAGCDDPPCAVYVTSPDYLGNTLDLEGIARVCRRHHVPLLVDSAHGAYLKFLPGGSRHPMDLGAAMCCDSAHKTLPALTGAAYLHIARDDVFGFDRRARQALSLFGSTSPSYLILQSLDAVNPHLADLPERLSAFLPSIDALKTRLERDGWALMGDEPLKLTLHAARRGFTGDALDGLLRQKGIHCEFHDRDYVTMMFTPYNTGEDLARIEAALSGFPPRAPLAGPPPFSAPERVMTPRQALFSPSESLPARECLGRVMAAPGVSCPPAIPIVMCGERIDQSALMRLEYYGIESCDVVM